jgi:hypothetical protein
VASIVAITTSASNPYRRASAQILLTR